MNLVRRVSIRRSRSASSLTSGSGALNVIVLGISHFLVFLFRSSQIAASSRQFTFTPNGPMKDFMPSMIRLASGAASSACRIRRRLDGDEPHKARLRCRSGHTHGHRIFRFQSVGAGHRFRRFFRGSNLICLERRLFPCRSRARRALRAQCRDCSASRPNRAACPRRLPLLVW
jgi:hypothetical protein